MRNRWGLLSGALSVVLWAGSATAAIVNPSFESQHDGTMPNGVSTDHQPAWGMPDDWAWRNSGHTNGHGIRNDDPLGWSSHEDWSLYVFAANSGSHVAGDYLEFYQTIDLTNLNAMSFDVSLRGGLYTESYFAVDSDKLWVGNDPGTLFDVVVDTSTWTGLHEIRLGVEVFEAFGAVADGWTYFDNITPEPLTVSLLAVGGLAVVRRRRRGPS